MVHSDQNQGHRPVGSSDSRGLGYGFAQQPAEIETESAQNLFSKAQINDVIKGLNLREGLFNEDDMKQLEAGYSVSDTEDELSAMNDILSAHSYYQSKAPYLKNADGIRSMIASSPVMEDGELDPA